MNILQQILVALAIVFLAWFFFFGGDQALGAKISPVTLAAPPENVTALFAQRYGDRLLQYNDPQFKFNIQYPIGYVALVDPDPSTRLAFTAFNPEGQPETIIVQIANEPYSDSKFEEDASTYPHLDIATNTTFELEKRSKTIINGRQAWLAQVKQHNPELGSAKQRQATIQCSNYTALVSALVPQGLEGDVPLADYMISNFKC